MTRDCLPPCGFRATWRSQRLEALTSSGVWQSHGIAGHPVNDPITLGAVTLLPIDLLTIGAWAPTVWARNEGATTMRRTVRRLLLGTSIAVLCSILTMGPAAGTGARVWTELRP